MGILDINPTIEKHDANFKKRVNASKFKNQYAVVDSYRWLYANMSVVYGSVIDETDILHAKPNREKAMGLLLHTFFDWYIKWCTAVQMYPITIFDGPSAPEKCAAHKKRNKAKEATLAKIEAMELALNSEDDLKKPDPLAYKKLLKQRNWVSKAEINEFKAVLRLLKIPYLLAKGEAEKLGSSLVIEGKASSLFTTDTDPLVYGCPSTVVDLRSEGHTATGPLFTIQETRCEDAYRALGLTRDQFIDYCIMLGTDYGDRIRGYGPVTCLELIKKHKNIENIVAVTGLDVTSLNHQFCRGEFKYVKSEDLIVEGTMIPGVPQASDIEEAHKILNKI
jgi:5'-3' exonuclease